MGGKKIEIVVGEVHGRLTITAEVDPPTTSSGRKRRKVAYVCSCGGKGEAQIESIRRGHTRSCGCLKRGNAVKHGKCGTRLYNVYNKMLNRCNNPRNNRYVNYGGKGIKVCEEWSSSFEAFDKWATSNGYEDSLTIERVEVNKGYSPDNCTWIPLAEQALNKRMSKTNTSGTTGVSYNAGQGKWTAAWVEAGKRKSRAFSVKKYGSDEAKQMAIAKRLEMEKLLGIVNNDP